MKLRWPLLAFLLAACLGSAQSQLDPNARLYRWLDIWAGKGLISHLPALRPYPKALVAELLARVEERGSPEDARIAAELEAGENLVGVMVSVRGATRDTSVASEDGLGVTAAFPTPEPLSLDAQFAYWLVANDPAAVQPLAERDPIDLINELNDAVLPIPGADLRFQQALQAGGGWYRNGLGIEVGLTRATFGPFFQDSVVIGPQAPASGNLLATYDLGAVRLQMALLALGQQPPSFPYPESNKFLVLQGFEFDPFSWLTLGMFESVVWQGRFEPLYLIPAFELFYVQSLAGFGDNSLLGLTAEARLPVGLKAMGQLYVDDFQFNDFIRGNFDTKWKLSAEAGLSWTPPRGPVQQLSIDYTAVMPYMYTHLDNLTNYTNFGVNLGPSLEPNSRRIELRAFSSPLSGLELEAVGRFIQHGNASEGIPGVTGPADGSIWDSGYDGTVPTFQPPYPLPDGMHYHRFLSQASLDTGLQAGLAATWWPAGAVPGSWGTLSISARYLFEYRWNEGLVPGANNAHHYFSANVTWNY